MWLRVIGIVVIVLSGLVLLNGNILAISIVISQGNTFEVDLIIDPNGQKIAGIQENISFDISKIRVNEVLEGNLFYQNVNMNNQTYFSGGTIDNSKGSVMDIISVVEGNGKFTDTQGIFAKVMCTAISDISDEDINSGKLMNIDYLLAGDKDAKATDVLGSIQFITSEINSQEPTPITINPPAGKGGSLPVMNGSQGLNGLGDGISQTPASILAQNVLPLLVVIFGITFVGAQLIAGSSTTSLVASAIAIVLCLAFLGVINGAF